MFKEDSDFNRADWCLLQSGAVNLFRNLDYFSEAQTDLRALGYHIDYVDCKDGIEAFYDQLSGALNWEEQFGYEKWCGNLNALNDAFDTYPFKASGKSVLAFNGFHKIVSADTYLARKVLDIIERSARDHLLWGKVLIALVQTDDGNYECENLGGRGASWNCKEWLRANRI